MTDPKPLSVEQIKNIVREAWAKEGSYLPFGEKKLDVAACAIYDALPSNGMVDKIINHEITNEKVDQMIKDISVHGQYMTQDGERIDPNDLYVKPKEGSMVADEETILNLLVEYQVFEAASTSCLYAHQSRCKLAKDLSIRLATAKEDV